MMHISLYERARIWVLAQKLPQLSDIHRNTPRLILR
jgi:hypothetical protein